MKTTVDIRDDLFLRAKRRAVELRRPLRSLIEQGLEEVLSATPDVPGRSVRIEWVTEPGGVPPGLDLGSRERMTEWLLARRDRD